jgi:hypothetical protein
MSAYCTQLAPDGSGHEACGAACLASVMLSEGWQSDPWGLTQQVAVDNGIWNEGATSQELLNAAFKYGFQGGLWYTWEEGLQHLRDGHGLLALNDNWLLEPRQYPRGGAWNSLHWVRLVQDIAVDGLVYTYDPLCYLQQVDGSVYQGPGVYTTPTVQSAIGSTSWPEAGIYLLSPSGKNLNVAH